MNCLSHATSYSAAILRGTRNFLVRSSFHHQAYYPPKCKTNFGDLGVKTIDLDFLLNRFRVQCYSSRRSSTAKTSRSRKLNTEPVMEQDKDEFFVVRKGDVVGVYKSLTECQAQVGSSVIFFSPLFTFTPSSYVICECFLIEPFQRLYIKIG